MVNAIDAAIRTLNGMDLAEKTGATSIMALIRMKGQIHAPTKAVISAVVNTLAPAKIKRNINKHLINIFHQPSQHIGTGIHKDTKSNQ